MRILFVILFLITGSLSQGFSQSDYPIYIGPSVNLSSYGLIGKVKKMEQTTIFKEDPPKYQKSFTRSLLKFDENGNLLECYSFNDSIHEYKLQSSLIYNENGFLTNWMVYKSDNSSFIYGSYKTDKTGKIIEESNYNKGGKMFSNIKYQYNGLGKVYEKEEIYFLSSGESKSRNRYNYDNTGNMIKNDYYNSSLITETNYIYNQVNQLIESKIVTHRYSGDLLEKESYINDSRGNLIEFKHFDSKGTLQKYYRRELEYDSRGNITKIIVLKDDKITEIITRVLEYY